MGNRIETRGKGSGPDFNNNRPQRQRSMRNRNETIGGEREIDFQSNGGQRQITDPDGRIFTLIGDKCISCNQPCKIYNKWATNLRGLGVEIRSDGIWRGEDNDYPTYICMYGERFDANGNLIPRHDPGDTLRPDLKQPDGFIPRVCIIFEKNPVSDIVTKKIISKGRKRKTS